MRFSRIINVATLAVALVPGSIAKADLATEWNAIAVQATAVPPNSILQSRVLAITHAAMYDAARVANRETALFAVGVQTESPSSPETAVIAAADSVLRRLAPAQLGAVDTAYQSALSAIPESSQKANSVKLGKAIAETLLQLRATDGSTQELKVALKGGPGFYQLTPPHGMQPILPQWGAVKPFVIQLDDSYKPKGPPTPNSAAFKADFDEVKLLGGRHSTARSADQTAAAIFWTVQTGVPCFAAARAAAAQAEAVG